MFLALSSDSLEELTSFWAGLTNGATIVEPLTASAWSAGFGMLTDKFGVTWSMTVTG